MKGCCIHRDAFTSLVCVDTRSGVEQADELPKLLHRTDDVTHGPVIALRRLPPAKSLGEEALGEPP